MTQQNRVTPSPSLLSFEFGLWTRTCSDLDCDNYEIDTNQEGRVQCSAQFVATNL